MNANRISRRRALARAGLVIGSVMVGEQAAAPRAAAQSASPRPESSFRYSLNLATLRGHKLDIVKQIEVAGQAGYDGIEPWVDSIEEYVKAGGTAEELRKRISDAGLTVEGAIGFPEWIVEDEARRAKGFERAKREMDLVARIGGKRFAAPPAGATDLPKLDPLKAAERYRKLLELGDELGLTPQLELWGFSKNLSRLGECVWVAMETGHPKACVLADVFHLYKGGADYRGLSLLGPQTVQVIHMNDYPSDPPRDKIDDSYRVYPGDGTAPLPEILRALTYNGGQKVLSLELFNREYWAQDALQVAKTGLARMKLQAAKAVASRA